MISLNQLIAIAKVANGASSATSPTLRKVWFNKDKVVATDEYILFEKSNSGANLETALSSDEIVKKIKIKDNKEFPFLMIEPGQVNSTPIKTEEKDYPDYKQIFPIVDETSYCVTVNKDLLETLLNCFEGDLLEITFVGSNKPLIIKNAGLNETGLIMPIATK